MTGSMSRTLFQALTRSHSPADGLTDAARRAEPANGLRHVAALSMSKVADGLIDPKLVLSWLLTALGAPALLAGLLVPIREAGALVPQVVLAGPVARMTRRKWAWVIGSAGQGVHQRRPQNPELCGEEILRKEIGDRFAIQQVFWRQGKPEEVQAVAGAQTEVRGFDDLASTIDDTHSIVITMALIEFEYFILDRAVGIAGRGNERE